MYCTSPCIIFWARIIHHHLASFSQGYGIVVKDNQNLIKSSNENLNLFSANILVVYGGE